jgi:hypothetical protein
MMALTDQACTIEALPIVISALDDLPSPLGLKLFSAHICCPSALDPRSGVILHYRSCRFKVFIGAHAAV